MLDFALSLFLPVTWQLLFLHPALHSQGIQPQSHSSSLLNFSSILSDAFKISLISCPHTCTHSFPNFLSFPWHHHSLHHQGRNLVYSTLSVLTLCFQSSILLLPSHLQFVKCTSSPLFSPSPHNAA